MLSGVAVRAADGVAPATVPAVEPARGPVPVVQPKDVTDLLERFVTWLHKYLLPNVDDGLFHWVACGVIFILAIVLRRIITNVIFYYLKKMAEKTETTLDDKLFPALEGPCAALVMVLGIFASLTVLQLSEHVDKIINGAANVAVLGVVLWGTIRAGGAILDHMQELADERHMTVATFMPLIKKTLLVFSIIVGILVIAQSLGANVGVFLTSLGIGGLAFALAAQDTIANLFGSFVVVMDQPFRVGDTVTIGKHTGTVEDIGLRSTKVRLVDRSLVVIPNKSVASEAITNLARFTGRRVEQVLGLSYDTTSEQMLAVIEDIRKILTTEDEIEPTSVHVYFRDYGASSLDIWVVYVARSGDFQKGMQLKQKVNLKIMSAVAARGTTFAFPTQTMHLPEPIVQRLELPKEIAKK